MAASSFKIKFSRKQGERYIASLHRILEVKAVTSLTRFKGRKQIHLAIRNTSMNLWPYLKAIASPRSIFSLGVFSSIHFARVTPHS